MSGSSLPYHLRTNKAIDRKIFFDLLGHMSSVLPKKIQEYKYVSMGGPMLEDQNVLHHELGMTKLYSIERDSAALSRQDYNKPYGCITCLESSTQDYIHNFDEPEQVVIWLDYTDTKWGTQFTECSDLLNQLKEYDLLKVTFNANPEVLKNDSVKTPLEIFKEKANHPLLSENLTDNDVKIMPKFAQTISNILKSIAEEALTPEGLQFHPLVQFRYIDNRHQMLTISGIVLKEDSDFPEKIKKHISTIQWPYLYDDWNDIQEINVPVLTLRERQVLNRMLPMGDGEIKLDELPFKFDKSSVKAQKMVKNYIKYYRYIPNYLRVVA